MEKKTSEEMQMAILNFQAMTETNDQEIAVKFLSQNNWDETVYFIYSAIFL